MRLSTFNTFRYKIIVIITGGVNLDIIDLHTHSDYSDGSMSPEEVIDAASKAGLRAVALTDHETAAGTARAAQAAAGYGIELVRGIELSTEQNQIEYHIGYTQERAKEYAVSKGLVVQAWSPLGRESVFKNEII